jgi:predicted dehydrogenase
LGTTCNGQNVEAIIIASPQSTHLQIAKKAFAFRKACILRKTFGDRCRRRQKNGSGCKKSGVVNMIGFNYIRTPASQFVRNSLQTTKLELLLGFAESILKTFMQILTAQQHGAQKALRMGLWEI